MPCPSTSHHNYKRLDYHLVLKSPKGGCHWSKPEVKIGESAIVKCRFSFPLFLFGLDVALISISRGRRSIYVKHQYPGSNSYPMRLKYNLITHEMAWHLGKCLRKCLLPLQSYGWPFRLVNIVLINTYMSRWLNCDIPSSIYQEKSWWTMCNQMAAILLCMHIREHMGQAMQRYKNINRNAPA